MTHMRHKARKAFALAVPAMMIALTACGEKKDMPQDALSPDGKYARLTDNLWNAVFPLAVIVFVIVQVLVLWLIIRYRRKGDDIKEPKQIHGNTKMEIGWTVLPALLLLFVGLISLRTLFEISERPSPSSNPLQVQVIGHQWWWEFAYPMPEEVKYNEKTKEWEQPNCIDSNVKCVRTANEMVIPVGRTIDATVQSKDVIHSFWVPKLAGKIDATSGRTNYLLLEANKPGIYSGQCAEFCGLSHANMRIKVRAVTPKEYDQWFQQQMQGPSTQATEAEQAGATLFLQKGCAGCHEVNGISKGTVGPNLTHFMDRNTFAGALFENNNENLRRWLRNPPEEKPGSLMPNLDLSEDEITSLVAYLNSLK